MKKIYFLFLLVILPFVAGAEIVEKNGIWYNLNNDDNTAEVIASQGTHYSGDISISSYIYQNRSYSITSIGESAFEGCTGLTSITIPNSVKSIEKGAFYGCSGLTSVKIPNGVTKIGLGAFSVCYNLESVIIPSSVTEIESYAFDHCTSLKRIVSEREQPIIIDNTVFETYDDPYNVYSMATLVVPNGTEEFYQSSTGWNRFSTISPASDQKIRSIHVAKAGTLSNFISDIEKYQIEELTITGELNGADFKLIRDMAGISWYVVYPEDTTSEVRDCSTPGKLSVLDILNAKIVSGGCYYEYGGSDSRAASRCSTKDNTISEYMFHGCNLTNLNLPNSVVSIGPYAFSDCSTLTSITIPKSVNTIESYAFQKFTGLTSITIPESVMTIGGRAFADCSNLTSIKIPESVTSVGYDAFLNTGWYNSQSNGALYLDKWMLGYKNDKPTGELTIADGTRGIVEGALRGCSQLISVIIPNSVKYICQSAFSSCSQLISVTIPNSVKTIDNFAFSGCYQLVSATIPNSVSTIGYSAFSGCSSLNSISIGNGVMSIDKYAFYDCSGLTTIVSEIINPFAINENVFNCSDKDVYATATLVVPKGTKDTYQSTEGWKKFANIVEIGGIGYVFEYNGINYKVGNNKTVSVTSKKGKYSGSIVIPKHVSYNGEDYDVTEIGNSAFDECRDLTSVIIPNSITSIGCESFYGCRGLTSIMIPNSVKTMGPSAFDECRNLNSVHITDLKAWCNISFTLSMSNPLMYAHHLYLNGEEIQDLVIPNSVTSISDYAFSGCSGLTSIIIPNSVMSIGIYAFSGCNGIKSLTISNSLSSISSHAFQMCSSLTCVAIPNGVTKIYDDAFYGCI